MLTGRHSRAEGAGPEADLSSRHIPKDQDGREVRIELPRNAFSVSAPVSTPDEEESFIEGGEELEADDASEQEPVRSPFIRGLRVDLGSASSMRTI
ncbi:MAG TPA: hypothetical protein VEY30_08670, partial [Myxococcaceae bacterium]|nr:hypothetical protein [Myxococcaceae bacterium]